MNGLLGSHGLSHLAHGGSPPTTLARGGLRELTSDLVRGGSPAPELAHGGACSRRLSRDDARKHAAAAGLALSTHSPADRVSRIHRSQGRRGPPICTLPRGPPVLGTRPPGMEKGGADHRGRSTAAGSVVGERLGQAGATVVSISRVVRKGTTGLRFFSSSDWGKTNRYCHLRVAGGYYFPTSPSHSRGKLVWSGCETCTT